MVYTKEKVEESLRSLEHDWKVRNGNGSIWCEFVFADFDEAIRFVNKVAEISNKEDHHPDIDIRYNKVTIALSTHSEGGVTEKDATFAVDIEKALKTKGF